MSDNDFTLDELKLIQDNLSWNDCTDINFKLIELNRKLQTMIDEYCEHDHVNTYNEREVGRCSKCGHV